MSSYPMFPPNATPTGSPIIHRHVQDHDHDADGELDGLETAILRRGSNPHSRMTLMADQKGEELAYCKSMACLLTQYRDLPKLCRSFPTVVKSVQSDEREQDHPLALSSPLTSMATSSSSSSSIHLSPQHQHHLQQQHQQQRYHSFAHSQSSLSTVSSHGSGTFAYYESVPPHSER